MPASQVTGVIRPAVSEFTVPSLKERITTRIKYDDDEIEPVGVKLTRKVIDDDKEGDEGLLEVQEFDIDQASIMANLAQSWLQYDKDLKVLQSMTESEKSTNRALYNRLVADKKKSIEDINSTFIKFDSPDFTPSVENYKQRLDIYKQIMAEVPEYKNLRELKKKKNSMVLYLLFLDRVKKKSQKKLLICVNGYHLYQLELLIYL